MEIFKKATNIDFLGRRRKALILSGVLIVIALISLAVRGLNYGIEFTGGTLVEISYPQAADLTRARSAISEAGFDDATVQHFGTSQVVLVRLASKSDENNEELGNKVFSALESAADGKLDLRRIDFIGPQVGEELTEQGGLAMLIALFAILIYVALRFEYRFAAGSVAALVHDVIITLGFFSILGLDFELSVLAAVLAVIGYSLNDTIVVFDRIRENFRKMRKGTPESIINTSLNQTLARTLMTSLTTLLVLLALFFLGGELIHGFATALIVGVVVGTYSSIYVASTTVLALGVSKADLMPVKKEDTEAEARP